MRLLPNDLRAVLQSIELLTSDLEPASMPVRTDIAVRNLISSDVVSFEGFGRDYDYQGPLWYTPAGSVSNERLQVIAEHVHEHSLLDAVLESRRRQGVRLSDYSTLSQFKKTLLYNEFFRYLDTDRQLTVGLEITKQLTITVSLCRLRHDFSDRDCSAIELLTPHLESAFRGSSFISALKRRSVAEDESGGGPQIHLTFVARDCSNYDEDPAVRVLLEKYFGSSGACLPDVLTRYVRHHVGEADGDDFHLPPVPIYVEGPDGTLRIRMLVLSTTKAIVLLIDETATHTRPASVAGVTGREREVLAWVACGKTDGEIADLLSISKRTVQKHLQNTYQKLGVETRTAAMAKFLDHA